MTAIHNPFKEALRAARPQIGLWLGLADPFSAELLAGTGFDWLVVDCEHAPNDLRQVLATLQAMAGAQGRGTPAAHPVVRPPIGDVALVKQLLEVGAQTLLVPMVDSAEQAARMAAAMRYPPRGIRGVGSSMARSSRWSAVPNYLEAADAQMCLLVQAESVTAMDNLESIAAVDGVDGVFFGPADLSASMGVLGETSHPRVVAAIEDGIRRVRAAGKAPGVLSVDAALARRYLDAGALFVAVGIDSHLLSRAALDLSAAFKTHTR